MCPILSVVPLGNGQYETVVARYPGDPLYEQRIKELTGISNFNENASSIHRR